MFERAFFTPYTDKWEPPKPVFDHDCRKCSFVGQVTMKTSPGTADVYVCNDSIIARVGNELGEYMSGNIYDYMHILLEGSQHWSDLRWLISQLYNAGILKLQATFIIPTQEPEYHI